MSTAPANGKGSTILTDVNPRLRYQQLNTIGEGSYGAVFRAMDQRTSKPVAIKLVKVDDPDEWHYVFQEVSFLSEIQGDNIIRYDNAIHCTAENELWIVMELCDLGSVMDLMEKRERPLNETQAAYVLHETLKGLRTLHNMKIIHRDIKAGNIMITSEGSIKLGDFGIAAKITETETKRKTFIGTPYWMAPEVITKSGHDFSADIWSLGITAIEITEGRPPYSDLPPMKAIFDISKEDAPLPTFFEPSRFSNEFKDFISKCCIRNPSERWTCDQLLEHPFIMKGAQNKNAILTFIDEASKQARRINTNDAQYTGGLEQNVGNTIQRTATVVPSNDMSGTVQRIPARVETLMSGTTVLTGTTRVNSDMGTTFMGTTKLASALSDQVSENAHPLLQKANRSNVQKDNEDGEVKSSLKKSKERREKKRSRRSRKHKDEAKLQKAEDPMTASISEQSAVEEVSDNNEEGESSAFGTMVRGTMVVGPSTDLPKPSFVESIIKNDKKIRSNEQAKQIARELSKEAIEAEIASRIQQRKNLKRELRIFEKAIALLEE